MIQSNKRFFHQRKFYFNGWPQVDQYNLQSVDYKTINFLHRWTFTSHVKENGGVYSVWTIRDNDTPFSISETLYKSPHHYWIIMMMNDIIDIDFRWPLNETQLIDFVDKKYGVEDRNMAHHWVSIEDGNDPPNEEILNDGWHKLPEGHIVDSSYIYGKEPISNYEHESLLNEERRKIKLLRPEYLQSVLDEKRSIIRDEFSKTKRR